MNTEKKRFNIFDILIGLVILALIGAIAYMLMLSPGKNAGADKTVEFVVEVQGSTLDVLDLVNEGDIVTLSGKSEAKIKSYHFTPAKMLVLDQTTGEYKISTIPKKYDIYATVTAKASETDKDISVGNTPVKVGAKISLEGKGYSINGAILEMTLYDANGEEIK